MGIFSHLNRPRRDKGSGHPHNITHNTMHASNKAGYPRVMNTQISKQEYYTKRAEQAEEKAKTATGFEKKAYEAAAQANLRRAQQAAHASKSDVGSGTHGFRKQLARRANTAPPTLGEYLSGR